MCIHFINMHVSQTRWVIKWLMMTVDDGDVSDYYMIWNTDNTETAITICGWWSSQSWKVEYATMYVPYNFHPSLLKLLYDSITKYN